MPPIINASTEVWHRDDIPLLCNWRKLWKMVEVGVDRAEYASLFLSKWQGFDYWGIDAYQPYPEMNFDRHADYLMAVSRLQPYARRVKLVKMPSVQAAQLFAPESVDFVYIDGAHDQRSVLIDIKTWWPKLTKQGIMAGHDWSDQAHLVGVKAAVREFFADTDQVIYLTSVEGYGQEECPSWLTYKSGIPGPDWRRC